MARQRAAGQVELGDYLFFFESPAGAAMADCYLVGHGGHVAERRFHVPDRTTVHFYTKYGSSEIRYDGPIGSYGKRPGGNADTRTAGSHITDLVLGKALGTHCPVQGKGGGAEYYLEIRQQMTTVSVGQGPNWLPHYACVRNRRFPFADTYLWLSNVIQLVQAHNPNVVNFYIAACRNVLSPDSERKILKKVGAQALQ
jgi:hypothetical protein